MSTNNQLFTASDDEKEKERAEHFDDVEQNRSQPESDEIAALSEEHRAYLLQRHGTLDLDPVPDMSDADPYNWATRKKSINLALVAFHAMMSTFSASAVQSAFVPIATGFKISLQDASYLVSIVIAVLGVSPLIWTPLANRFGRRPICLISLVGSLVANIGCANCYSYGAILGCRAVMAFFISPPLGFGSAVVAETFFKKDRARAMGVWTLLVTLGVPMSAFIFGFVALRVAYRWIYYILAITNAVQLILYTFLGPESRYVRPGVPNVKPSVKHDYFYFRRIDPTPLTWWSFLQPFSFAAKPCVMIPAVAYSMVFSFGSVFITQTLPQVFAELFQFNTQQIGLNYIALVIGSVLGEQVGGIMSDRWMAWRRKRLQRFPPFEFRLWLSYIGYALAICGMVVFLVQLGNIKSYNVTPSVGAAIAAAGNQIVTTVMVTYAVDCYRPQAASVGVFINFVRQIWGFIGPFWFPQAIATLGFGGTAGLVTGMIVAFSVLPTMFLQWRGQNLH